MAIEFAFLFPVVLAAAVGALEFGRVFMAESHLTAAARVGARTGVVRGADVGDVNDAIGTYLSSTFLGTSFSTEMAGVGSQYNPESRVTVTVSYDLPLMLGSSFSASTDGTFPLSASVTMRHQ